MSGPPPQTLYELDFVTWLRDQAERLQALPNPPAGLDIDNIVEELETLARREVRKLEELIRGALIRLILSVSGPDPEARRFASSGVPRLVTEVRRRWSPGCGSDIALDRLWAEAREEAAAALPEGAIPDLPIACPFPLEMFIERGFSLKGALGVLTRSDPPAPETPNPEV